VFEKLGDDDDNEMGSGLFWVERRSAEQKWWRSRKMKPF
jgi:hypothetical protein